MSECSCHYPLTALKASREVKTRDQGFNERYSSRLLESESQKYHAVPYLGGW